MKIAIAAVTDQVNVDKKPKAEIRSSFEEQTQGIN
jgi:hypothetical protein